MKTVFSILLLSTLCFCEGNKQTKYTGSTPADTEVRSFLGISLTDSIDFIRWKVAIDDRGYTLDCRYGIGKPNTNGFYDEKKVVFSGQVSREGNYYRLQNGNKGIWLLQVNDNIFHLLNKNKKFLIGNGGFSYALNNETPVKTDHFNLTSTASPIKKYIAYQGRTPCGELGKMVEGSYRSDCYKMKWYMILYVDSVTGKPSYYLQGGRAYKKESMLKRNWEIVKGKNGKIIYKLESKNTGHFVYLLKADDDILFFTDAEGNLLVGDEDFSFTLNRTFDREP